MRNILLTGGAGYIGSKVSYDLIDDNFNVIIVDDLSNSNKKLIPKKAIFKKIDISNYAKLENCFKLYKFEAVYHFAAKKKVDESQKKPLEYFNANVIGTNNLLNLIAKYKVKNFIFSSTCAIYGNSEKKKVLEDGITLPLSYYGLTKLIAENMIRNYHKKFKFNYAILRYFNVIGSDYKNRTGEINSGSLFKNIISSLKNKKKFFVFGKNYKTKDGTCIRDYIDLNDLSELHLLSHKYIKKKKSSILFNCGTSKPFSVLDVIKKFEDVTKNTLPKDYKKRRLGDIEKIYSDNRKQRIIFPKWKPKFSLKESVINTLRWENIKF